ncbi:hypothetical protein [Acrocarpospora catenulata]|uniref:hypothetical protein n=1 Tax=Acrocarpospora catenulata TaxID=2836182 RepID=UPI001BDA604C|nr:hypothetical protein [Acrocarpospora catenulata]
MRKSLRNFLAGVSGAALIASGAAITATPANAAPALGDPTFVDSFLPPSGNSTIDFSVKLTDAFATNGQPAKKVWARFTKDDTVTPVVYANATVTQPAAVTTVPNPNEVIVKGAIPVSSSDVPSDKWKLELVLSEVADTTAPTSGWSAKDFTVAAATRVTNVSIDPSTVTIKSGSAVDVGVRAVIEKYGDEVLKDVRLESKSDSDYYSLGTGMEADGKTYYDYATLDSSTTAGNWQVNFTITRGSKTYSFVKGFTVKKGTAAKAKSKVTFTVSPTKVKKGKSVKMYGTVYRGYTSWGPWKKKILKLYFKKKGTKTWKFVTYIGANNSGKYTKTIKPKYDGYWRVGAFATSLTSGKWSAYKFVDVR